MILSYTYFVLCWFLGFLLLLAGASKLVAKRIDESPPSGKVWAVFFRLSQTPAFAVVELSVGLLFCLIPSTHVRAVLAACVAVMVVIGIVVRKKRNNAACMCFGSLTPKNPATFLALELFLMALAIGVAVIGVCFPDHVSLSQWVAWPSVAMASLTVALLIRSENLKDAATLAKAVKPTASPATAFDLPSDLALGRNLAGKTITFGDVVPPSGPLFIVGVHTACKMCKSLIPDLIGFAKGFGEKIPMLLISNEPGYVVVDHTLPIHVLVDENEVIARGFHIDSRPFALLINGETGKVMAPPSLGNDGIRRLFAVMLNARQPAVTD